MFSRKGRGSAKTAPACLSSMPACTCRETSLAPVWGMRQRLVAVAVLGTVAVVVLTADPIPWDVVLTVLVALLLRG